MNMSGCHTIPRNDESNIPGPWIEPQSDKERPEVEIAKEKEVELTNVVIPVNVNNEDEEITDEVYESVEMEHGNIQAQISTQIDNAIAIVIPSQVDDQGNSRRELGELVVLRNSTPFARYGVELLEDILMRTNDCIVSITEPDYKNLNKNNIEDIYLLIMNGKRVNLTAPTMTFPRIEDHEMFSIIYEPVHGIIYKNSKKEKWVMRHSEIHKFCDATLNRVLKGLKSYNNDFKYGYIQTDLTKDETEYLKLFEEEIEASEADEKMGDVREWKTTWTKKRMP
ncbi:hypothetical protein Tco_0375279 [Tanacetum coccineum]